MEDSLQISLFAHDLMNYVMRMDHRNIQLPIDENMRRAMGDNSPFNDTIGEAVLFLMDNNRNLIQDECQMAQEIKFDVNIGHWAMRRVAMFCSKGYDQQRFLLYSSVVVGIASYYSMRGRVGLVKLLTEILASVLTSYVMTTEFKLHGGFERMTSVADELLNVAEALAEEAVEATETATTAPPKKSDSTAKAATAPSKKSDSTEKAATNASNKSEITEKASTSPSNISESTEKAATSSPQKSYATEKAARTPLKKSESTEKATTAPPKKSVKKKGRKHQ